MCSKRFGTCSVFVCFAWCFLILNSTSAQKDSSSQQSAGADISDTVLFNLHGEVTDTTTLESVTVTAFGLTTRWKNAPAAIAVINNSQLRRFDDKSLVPVMNTVAGVRMEERSPGSYRLSVRGSLLRSPFGIRNIKIYWNDIPLTDAGGNTYLNLVDLNQVRSIEIVKGPAGSAYGANTGGAVLLRSGPPATADKNTFSMLAELGSYGLFNEQVGWNHQDTNVSFNIRQSHLQCDGYRQQSAMRRDAILGTLSWDINRNEELSALLVYSNLHYETPGGLTKQQMDSVPTLARQPAGSLPGAVEQQAGVYNKTGLAGFTLRSVFNNTWSNATSVTINHTDFKNPFITNYEHRDELNYGGRTAFALNASELKWLTGAEWQQNVSHITNYANNGGVTGEIFFEDKIRVTQYFLFTQLNLTIKRLIVQAGVSAGQQLLKFNRVSDSIYNYWQQQNTSITLSPRLSLLYEITNTCSGYGIISKGFSPPTLAEVRPSTNQFYDLQPEYGWNFEAGLKGSAWHDRFEFDLSAYIFNLKNAIVRQTDSSGADFFVNAGGTKQPGIEAWFSAHLIRNQDHFITELTLSNSFAYQPYKFSNYISGTKNFSGNRLTGVPKSINVSSLDINTIPGIYLHSNFNLTSSIPLTDANDVYADAYQLFQLKLGYRKKWSKTILDIFLGADNLLDETYSLGNDLNAAGGRYFNPAPKRNYFAGLSVDF